MINRAELNKLTERIIGAAIEVHRHLGPGLLESAYETCLAYELEQQGLAVERKRLCPWSTKRFAWTKATESICSLSKR